VLAFDYPWLLVGLLLLLPLPGRAKRRAVAFPLLDLLDIPPSPKQRLLWFPKALAAFAQALDAPTRTALCLWIETDLARLPPRPTRIRQPGA